MFSVCSHTGHAKPLWYDPDKNPSQWLDALWRVRHLCTRAEAVLPHMRAPGSYALIQAIKTRLTTTPSARPAIASSSGIGPTRRADGHTPPREGVYFLSDLPYGVVEIAMATLVSERTDEPWRRRAFLPVYEIAEAARYADVAPNTVAAWHKTEFLSRKIGASLNYMQLIEVAVVAAFRKMGVKLDAIRAARAYALKNCRPNIRLPSIALRSKQSIYFWILTQIDLKPNTVVQADQGGQLTWQHMIGRLNQFDYEDEGFVTQWHVAGRDLPIVIDPRSRSARLPSRASQPG